MRIATLGLCDPGYSEDVARAYYAEAVGQVKKSVSDIVDVGLQPDEKKSPEAITTLRREHAERPFDALFLMQVAWSRPGVLLQVVRAFPNLPMVVYSPGSRIEDGVIRSIAPTAGTGSTLPILRRHGIVFKYVWSVPGTSIDEAAFMPFLRAAQAARKLRGARLGMVGFGDMRLQSTGFDVQEVHETFGVEVESIDMLELEREMEKIGDSERTRLLRELTDGWTYHGVRPSEESLKKMIALYAALDRYAVERGYIGLSIKCPTGVTPVMGITPCLTGCLLARKYHYVCENDIPGLLGQVALGLMSGQMSTYWELYEVLENGVLLGCCGFCPEVLLDEPMKVRTLEGFMEGMSCCSRVQYGTYTLARLSKDVSGEYVFDCHEGEAFEPPVWYEDACGMPQHPSVRFMPEDELLDEFVRGVTSQHFAVVQGRWAEALEEFADMKGIALV